jgi:hypothetical protein
MRGLQSAQILPHVPGATKLNRHRPRYCGGDTALLCEAPTSARSRISPEGPLLFWLKMNRSGRDFRTGRRRS